MMYSRLSFVAFVIAGLLTSTSSATLLLVEDFNYADGPLNGQGGAVDGWSTAWTAFGPTSVDAGQLRFSVNGTSGAASAFRSNTSIAPPNDGESYYMAFDLTVVGSDVSNFMALSPTGAGGAYWRPVVDGVGFGINGGVGPAGSIVNGQTYRVVTRGTRNDSGTDPAVLWVDPSAESDAPLLTYNLTELVGISTPIADWQFSANPSTATDYYLDNFVL
ncbi:MAG: hypothetical protein KDA60_08425, partial [Planctomycetales bacterium]|nr:hypothetical protein [Planctomycetales bacterium]